MKVLMLSNKAPFPPNDGSSIAIYTMARGFIDNQVELHLLTINTKKHYKPDADVLNSFKINSHYQSVYLDASINPLGALLNLLFSKESYFVSRFYFPDYIKKLKESLQNNNFDWVQLEGIFMAVYIPIIKKYSKAKISIRTHNAEHVIWNRVIANEKSKIKKWYLKIQNKRLKKFELNSIPLADAIIPITKIDEEIFRKENLSFKSYVCPTGILQEDFAKNSISNPSNTIFHLGSMDWIPNCEGIIWFIDHVWPLVLSKNNKAQCYIAGRNMPQNIYNKAGKGIHVIGEVKNATEIFNRHDIMIVPLLSGSGMRIKIVDGLRLGKAIVSTSIGAEGINVKNGKEIRIADTPEEFAEAIHVFISNPEYLRQVSTNAITFARNNLDNTKLISGLIDFYKNL